MFKYRSRALVLAFFVFLCGIASAEVAEADKKAAAEAPQRYFQAIDAKDYAAAWNLLTEESKSMFVTLAAGESKMPVAQVRQLFDTTDPSIIDGFWTYYRDGAKADFYAKAEYVFRAENNGRCLIVATLPIAGDDNKTIYISKNEGGFKFGLVETAAALSTP